MLSWMMCRAIQDNGLSKRTVYLQPLQIIAEAEALPEAQSDIIFMEVSFCVVTLCRELLGGW
jgi:hypothetical protein